MKKDLLLLGISNVLVKLIGLFLIMIFNVLIKEDGVLLFSCAYVPSLFFCDLSSLGVVPGFSLLTSRFIKNNKKEELAYIFKRSRYIMFIIGILFSLIFILVLNKMISFYPKVDSFNVKILLICIIPSILIFPLLSLYRGFLLGQSLIKEVAISIIVEHIIRYFFILVIGVFIINILKYDSKYAIYFAVIAMFLGFLASYLYIRNKVDVNKNTSKTNPYIIFKYFIPIGIATTFMTIYLAIDLFFVNKIETENMGLFMFSIPRLIIIPILLSQGIAATIMPKIVKSDENNSKKIKEAIDLVMFISIMFIYIYIALSNNIYSLFYHDNDLGKKILENTSYLIFLYSLNKLMISLLQGIKKLKTITILSLFSYVIKIIINIIFIKVFSYYTFLLSSTLAVVLIIVGSLSTLQKENVYKISTFLKTLFSYLFYGLLAYIVILSIMFMFNINSNNYLINLITTSLFIICYYVVYKIIKLLLYKEEVNTDIKHDY